MVTEPEEAYIVKPDQQDFTRMNNIELENEVKVIARTLIHEKGFVCAIDLLLRLDYLSKKDYEDWRFGRVRYLEKVCKVNLRKLSSINRTISKLAMELGLENSRTVYNQYGKGIKRELIFS